MNDTKKTPIVTPPARRRRFAPVPKPIAPAPTKETWQQRMFRQHDEMYGGSK